MALTGQIDATVIGNTLASCADGAVVPVVTSTTTTTTTVCVPNCSGTGTPCGPDGCGGSCGTCPSGEVCTDGACTLPICPFCGDGICESDEDLCNCPVDCGDGQSICKCIGFCGDGTCDVCENNESCPQDCPLSCEMGSIICPVCGDNTCNGDETGCNCGDCPPRQDCPKCLLVCGDGNCDGCESHESCPADCALDCGTCPCP